MPVKIFIFPPSHLSSRGQHMELDLSDFERFDLRAGRIVKSEAIKGSDKLLRLEVDVESEKRQVVAGIRQWYAPEGLVGKRCVIVMNIEPAKIFGVESRGMLLAAQDENGVAIVVPEREIAEGSRVR